MRRAIAILIVLAPAGAGADPVAEARHFFDRGNEKLGPAMRMRPGGGRDRAIRGALEEYLQSVRIVRSKNALFNVGLCYEELREWDSAFGYYSEYLGLELSADERTEGTRRRDALVDRVALVEVVTRPAGATVYVDRRDLAARGQTPVTLAVAAGERRILIDMGGHDAVARTVTAAVGARARVEVDLVARPMTLDVSSDPPGAEVRIGRRDGPVAGTTPAQVRVPAGQVRVFVTRPGFDPIEEVARGAPGETVMLRVSLAGIPSPGMLRIASNVAGARVEVDGETWGEAGGPGRGLRPGRHEVTVSRAGYRTARSSVEVREGRTTTVTATLQSEHAGSRLAPWPTIALVGAVLAAGGGAAVGAAAIARQDELDKVREDWEGARADSPEADRARQDAHRVAGEIDDLNRTADTLYIVGAALGVGWIVLTIADSPAEGQESTLRVGIGPGGVAVAGVMP
jgi:hypothetical protein